ncbi:hypothetical protein [Kingella potus]|uniref:hypothetical protein n=1 Tax=Kingella potus TaxID=265175 RepID=UPI001FD0F2D1|nr:hypothetical protein [Kingella potus]UOP00823.1 hypothetical protein LVJ84_13960 [Kingella potus]
MSVWWWRRNRERPSENRKSRFQTASCFACAVYSCAKGVGSSTAAMQKPALPPPYFQTAFMRLGLYAFQ